MGLVDKVIFHETLTPLIKEHLKSNALFLHELETDKEVKDNTMLVEWQKDGVFVMGGAFMKRQNGSLEIMELFGKYPKKRRTIMFLLLDICQRCNYNKLETKILTEKMERYVLSLGWKKKINTDNYYQYIIKEK